MTTILPPIPRFVFTIFEPIALLGGALSPLFDISFVVNSQIPSTPVNTPVTATDKILALQLCNCYGLLLMIGIGVLYTTAEASVVRNYMIACAVADVGHIAATYHVMGYEDFADVGSWNGMAWGNIGVTAFLFVSRVLYLVGVFGKDRIPQVKGDLGKKRK